jgi:alpha-L-fucosidase
MFVHFGVYAPLGKGEWAMYHENIRRPAYEKLMQAFDPHRFDADEWVDVAERAGARYITVTAKHHDGFCLFDSDLTEWKITNTPFGRDLIGELVAACQRRGVRIILYYSQPDWHHPNYVHLPGAFKDLWYTRPDDEPDWPKYQAYLHGQVRELVTKYGPVDGIWFDGSHKSQGAWRGKELYDLIKRHQPHAVVNDRARYGDFLTPERSLPEDLTGYLFEACESVTCISWGWRPGTPLHNSPHLIDSLVRMAGAGGNYLLNVSPRPDGSIPQAQVERMAAIGDWLQVHGDGICGTEACQLEGLEDNLRSTRREEEVHVFLRRWPTSDHLLVPGIRSLPVSAHLCAGGSRLQGRLVDGGLELSRLPTAPPDANPQAIRLRFAAQPDLELSRPEAPAPRAIPLHPHEPTLLRATDAVPEGFGVKGARLQVEDEAITRWTAEEQRAVWVVRSEASRDYRVRIWLRCAELYAGSTFSIRAVDQQPTGTVEGHDAPDQDEVPRSPPGGVFYWQDVGTIRLPAGETRLELAPTYMPYGYVFAEVKGLELGPA